MNPNNRFLASSDDDAILCVACNKEVYPNDRVMALKGNWHRGCLKCTECGITLSVRMLESFQNKPYCRAHKPNPRSTQVTDSVAIKTATGNTLFYIVGSPRLLALCIFNQYYSGTKGGEKRSRS